MPGDTMPLRRSLEIQRGGACYIDFAPNGAGGQAAVPQSAVAAEAMADRTKRVRAVYHLDTGEALAKVDSTVCPPRAPCLTPHASRLSLSVSSVCSVKGSVNGNVIFVPFLSSHRASLYASAKLALLPPICQK